MIYPSGSLPDDCPLHVLCCNDTCSFTWTGAEHINQVICSSLIQTLVQNYLITHLFCFRTFLSVGLADLLGHFVVALNVLVFVTKVMTVNLSEPHQLLTVTVGKSVNVKLWLWETNSIGLNF